MSGEESTVSGSSLSPVPATIGDYRIARKLGEGGMGIVYEAEQQHPKRPVALKVISGRYVDEQQVKLFQRESQTLARLRHPGIAAIYESGRTADGQHFFAMELVRGETLTEHLAKRGRALHPSSSAPGLTPAEVRERLSLFRRMCDAVAYAHQRGVIHRDIKPSNILVVRDSSGKASQEPAGSAPGSTAGPEIKILDFGLARITDTDVAMTTIHTEIGKVQGTLPYMSPEQVRGNPDEIDLRTDVYSLGVVLYEMLTGQLPYSVKGTPLVSAARVICEEPPAPLSRTWKGTRRLDGDVATIVLKALEKEPARRYQSVSALAEDVERYLTDQPILARPPSALYQLRKLVARHKAAFASAAALVVLLAGFAVTMAVQAGRIARERDRANQEAERAMRESETARHVSDFLLGLFQVSDPGEAQGNTVTARKILDRGASQIAGGLKDQPLVRATMMETMGKVYRNLGLADSAAPLLEEALEIRETILGPENPDVARSLYELALVGKEGHLALHRRALEIRAKTRGPDHPDVGYSMWAIGTVLAFGGDPQGARRSLERALRIFEKDPESNSIGMSWCLNDLGVVHFLQGNYEAAGPLFERALEIKEKKLGPNHWDTANGLNSLGSTLAMLGDYEEAKPLLERSLAIYERVFGPDNASVGGTLHSLGELLHLMHRNAEAKPLLERAVALFERPGQGERLARPLVSLALVLLELGETERAEACYQRALAFRHNVKADAFQLDRDLETYAARKRSRRAPAATVPGR